MGIMRGIQKSRDSYLNYDEMRWVMTKWDNVLEKMHNRDAQPEEIEEAKMNYGVFMKRSGCYLTEQNNKGQRTIYTNSGGQSR